MRSTRCRGLSASISRVPVARPRTATAARSPDGGPRMTVHPVPCAGTFACPTVIPGTAARFVRVVIDARRYLGLLALWSARNVHRHDELGDTHS